MWAEDRHSLSGSHREREREGPEGLFLIRVIFPQGFHGTKFV